MEYVTPLKGGTQIKKKIKKKNQKKITEGRWRLHHFTACIAFFWKHCVGVKWELPFLLNLQSIFYK